MEDFPLKQATLCLLVKGAPPSHVLLGYKKVGFGQGKYGGFGGKVEDGESIEAAATREMEEETGLRITPDELQLAARLAFLFPFREDWSQLVHLFIAQSWQGELVESDEMQPAWFAVDEIPYRSMWADGEYWLPLVLAGRRIQARFVFGEDNETVREAVIEELDL